MIKKLLSKATNEEKAEVKSEEQIRKEENIRIQKMETVVRVLIDEIKDIINLHDTLNTKIKNLEEEIKKIKAENEKLNSKLKEEEEKKSNFEEKVKTIESNMEKFVGLYEAITNMYNPFIKKDKIKELQDNNDEIKVSDKNKVVIEDKITGKKEEVSIKENQQKKYDIPKGKQVNPEIARKEATYFKYLEGNNFNELYNQLKSYEISEEKVKDLLKGLSLISLPDDERLSFNNKTYNNFKEFIQDIVSHLSNLNENNILKFKTILHDSIQMKYPEAATEIMKASTKDDLKEALLRSLIDYIIAKKESKQDNKESKNESAEKTDELKTDELKSQ